MMLAVEAEEIGEGEKVGGFGGSGKGERNERQRDSHR